MAHLEQEAFRSLQNRPQNSCVFCQQELDDTKAHKMSFEVFGKRYGSCQGCVEYATDLRDRDFQAEDIRDEFLQAQTLQCHLCGRPGATIICSNFKQCGMKYHWSCRRDWRDSGSDCSKCSHCTRVEE